MSVPPSTLTPETFADRLYAALAPLAAQDEETGWSLLVYVNAIGTMFQLVEDLVRDTADGPGWSILLDLDRVPDAALPWLAQFAGVRIPVGLSSDDARAWVASTDGFRRGTRDAMVGALAATLTAPATVFFVERSGNPTLVPEYAYFISVRTYTSQTPNPAASHAALLAQKPGGLVLDYQVVAGQSWQQLKASGRTWAQVKTDFATWDAVRSYEPS